MSDLSCVDDAQAMRAAAAELVATQVFSRSPTLSRLLLYLVDMTIRGEADRLKSYTVGIDGLGRQPDSENPDGYARVQITRLRKALDSHYAVAGRSGDRLSIDPGTYRVRLIHAAPAELPIELPAVLTDPLTRPAKPVPASAPAKRRSDALVFAAVLLLVAIAGVWVWMADAQRKHWRTPDFPYVSVSVERGTAAGVPDESVAMIERNLLAALAQTEGIRAKSLKTQATNFQMTLTLASAANGQPGQLAGDLTVVDLRTGRLIWSAKAEPFTPDEAGVMQMARSAAFDIGSPTGAIPGYARRIGTSDDSPFGCWLHFTGDIEKLATIGDQDLVRCSRSWYSAAPNHPLAAAAHGWVLTDESILESSADARREKLGEAMRVINQARVLNPASSMLSVAAMRAQSFAGNRAELRQAADNALRLKGDNPDVVASVGLFLVLWQDPQGETLLADAFSRRTQPPQWYHVGPAVAALMRNSSSEVAHHLALLDELDEQTFIALLFAAHEAKIGHKAAAVARLKRKPFNGWTGGMKARAALQRLPVDPAVRKRLNEWLEPAIAGKG